jgi:DHA1 family bicyclomycin/chloramphenicol resistance-like MFS transporter
MTAPTPSRSAPGWLLLIGVMTGIGPVSIDLYLPGFPLIESSLNERGVERTMAAYLVGLALGQLLYGPVSDRIGRKPPLYFGFIVYTMGAVGCALAQTMWMLMAFRVVQAIGACSGIAIGRAIVRDRCEPEQAARAFSTLMMIVSVAPILAPIAGGFIVAAAGWRTAFFFQAALGIGILIAMHFMLDESLDPKHIQPLHLRRVLKNYLRLLKDRGFVGYTLVGGFGMAALFSYVAGAPTILTRTYKIAPQTFGFLIGVNGLAFMTSSRLNLRALRTHSAKQILARYVWIPVLLGVALILAGILTVPLALVVALQFVFFLTTARIMPNVSATALAQHAHVAGSASALLGALQSIVSMFAGVAIATFNDGTLLPLAILMTGSVTIGALIHLWAARTNE